MLVVDASVLVAAAFSDEVAHPIATAFLHAVAAAGVVVHEPSMAVVEVTAGIVRRSGDVELGKEAVDLLLGLPGVVIHDLGLTDALTAAGVASQLRLRAADAVYAALADAVAGTLVTLDTELLGRASGLIDACTPETWLTRGAA